MKTSTPLVNSSTLRKSVLLKDITNSTESNKRRISNVINQSLTLQTEADDELERSIRRNEADIQRRLSSIGSPKSPQLSNEKEIRDHFQICLKMYAENKISAKNAWNLKIIDYMRTVLYSQGMTKDSLQVASTSLDVSTKIYGIRVDDIHSEGFKLASNMARVNANREISEENEDQDEGVEEDGDKKTAVKKPKKKSRMFSGQKTTMAKDPKSLLTDIVKLESVFFQTRMNLQSSCIDNLFTNRLPMNHSYYKFMLLSKEKAWPSRNDIDPNVNFEKKFAIEIEEVQNLQICAPFADFEIDEWDPSQEEQLLSATPVLNDEVVYDSEGIPIPELDGSVHDLFANADAENQYASSEDEDGNRVGQDAVLTNQVAHIIDFRPEENGVHADEYSYSSSVTMIGNKRITQLWAGPSHWKLKHVRRTASRFSGQTEKQTNKPVKRTRIQPTLIDFYKDPEALDKTKIFKAKRYKIDESPIKCTLPQVIHTEIRLYRSLMLKPILIKMNQRRNKEITEDPEVKPYNYENPNDSYYCSQNGVDGGDNGGPPDDADCYGDDGFQNEEEVAIPQENFNGENLIDAPEQVPANYITYALQAKKMDMKKLKIAVWKCLPKPNEVISDEGMYNIEVTRITFSEIYKQVPSLISENMQKELSCPLALVALLHLTNEQNLKLTGHPDLKDITVEQAKYFKP